MSFYVNIINGEEPLGLHVKYAIFAVINPLIL